VQENVTDLQRRSFADRIRIEYLHLERLGANSRSHIRDRFPQLWNVSSTRRRDIANRMQEFTRNKQQFNPQTFCSDRLWTTSFYGAMIESKEYEQVVVKGDDRDCRAQLEAKPTSRLNDDLPTQLPIEPRPCGLFDAGANWRQLRNVYRNLQLRKRMASRQYDCTYVFEASLACESLVAYFTLMFLLCTRRYFRAKLAHH